MNDTKSNVPQQFGIRIKNNKTTSVNIALFAGAVDTTEEVTNDEDVKVTTKGDARNLNKMGLGNFDAVLCDGILPDKDKTINTKADNVVVSPLSSTFSINHMREHLKSNHYRIKRMIIKATSQDQFDNQISIATICPFQNYGISHIAPTNYSLPSDFQNNKIVIDDMPYILGDDTFIGWTINAGETVNITFELE